MLSLLLWCCLFVTTLSQVLTHVAKEDGALHIENIQYDGKFTHLTMKKMTKPKGTKVEEEEPRKLKKGDFEWVIKGKSKILGHYTSFNVDSHKMVNVEFEYFPQMALSTLESLITKGMIKYDGKFIKAPPLYMISAHGVEYKKLLKPPELSSMELMRLEWDNRDNPTPKPTMGPTVDSLNRKEWPYKSTIYFFSPRYTCITMLDGEKYSKWFEGAEFMKLKNVVKTRGEVVKTGDMISEHYASYGTEFEVSSGVYRLIKNRKTKKWEVEIIARLPEETKKALVKLSDIVDILEQIDGYGPGIVYWNACREDTTKAGIGWELPGKHGTTSFSPLFDPLNPQQTEEWRKSVIKDCENEYEKAWEETIEFATKEMADFKRLVEKAVVKRKDNIQAKKEIVEEFYKSVKKISTRPKETPKISVHDCYGAGYRVKTLQQEIRNKYIWAQQKIMGLVESEKEKSTKKLVKLPIPNGGFRWVEESSDDSDESEFHFIALAHGEYSNYYDGRDDIRRHRHRRRHGHQHTMSYYDKLLEKEEMMDILRDMNRDMNRDNKGKQTNPYYY